MYEAPAHPRDVDPYIGSPMPTFLFTDIEASTRLWEEHPSEMAAALARHDSILTQIVGEAGGSVVKTTGDGIVAVFESVSDGLEASIRAQTSLSSEPWGPTGPLRVRMGIHSGETETRDGDYFGQVMNRTARIMAAGHGGQILVSAAVARLADAGLPDGAGLIDLGAHRLKDLTLPEHLYQLAHPDLESTFPAPNTLDTRPHNLPQQGTEFLGRESELAAIQLMLEAPSTRLLTITGPGGAGKTRLSLQVAAEQLDRFRDGVFFVDMSAERDPDAAYEAVVRALDLPASGGGSALQLLKSRLRDREMLLVLDNLEQVTAAGVGLAELLQHAPDLSILVTSRETLRVRAEHVYPVPPLALPDPRDGTASIAESEAVQLFVERARAVNPGFAIGEGNAGVIAEICLRLDGLPLAIELAAARLNVFSPADLLDRLQDRLDVLGAGGRDLPDRQRTLWGAVGWSYELLEAGDRDLFELMSVFSTADLRSIESVATAALGEGYYIDSLSSLVDKSLVRGVDAGGSDRFSMLLTIKEFAESRLAQDPEREGSVRNAHALHYSDFAEGLHKALQGAEREAALADLTSEIGNLRTAWRYWVDQGDLERLFTLIDALWVLHEAKGWYHAAMELASDTLGVLSTSEPSPELAAEELALRTSLARALMAVRGFGPEVEEAFQKVLDSSATGTATQRFPVLRALATYHMNIADFARSGELGSEMLAMGESEGELAMSIEGHYVFGAATAFTGDLEIGLAHLDRAIELHDPGVHGSTRFRLGPNTGVVARVASGLTRWQCGALDQAIVSVGQSLDIAREIDHPFSIAYALYHNGFLALNRGRFDECSRHAGELATVAGDNDYLVWQTLATVLEGVSLTATGSPEQGVAMTERGIDLYQGLTTPPIFWPLVLLLRSMVHAMAGNAAHALELIDQAIAIGVDAGVVGPEFLIARGDIQAMLPGPDLDSVEQSYRSGIELASTGGLLLIELQGRNRLVTLRRSVGRPDDGSEELAALFDRFTEGHGERDLVQTREILGR